jgi:hypothetical protein
MNLNDRVSSNQFLVGVYDNSEEIVAELIEALGPHKVIAYSDSADSFLKVNYHGRQSEELAEAGEYLLAKDAFFESCSIVVIKIDSMGSISFFTGAINALLKSQIDSLMVISNISIEPLLGMGTKSEKESLQSLLSSGRFVIFSVFSLAELLKLMQMNTIGFE